MTIFKSMPKRTSKREDIDQKGVTNGDNVLIYKEKLGNKLGSAWQAGFKVKNKIFPDAYLVTNGQSTLRLNKAHILKDLSKGEEDVVITHHSDE